jgi:UDP-GlcNAc:undecaprenyl-phosphate GlcNAc-1-phosphate transferase
VIILWAWTAILSGFVLVPLFFHQANAFIPLGAAALGAGLYTLFHPGLRKGNGDDADEALDQAPSPGSGQSERRREMARLRP